ncbi:MAG: hypothetical protein LCH79_15470 [Proteobacteria bacterium]|nr:hypothetical protein [Pseudomonadota bacterium]
MDKATVESVMALLNPCCVTFAKWKELGKRGRTAEEEDAALREMRDAQEAFRAEVERLAAQAAPTADRWHDAALPPEIEQRLAPWLTNGAALHPATINLVVRFARALSKKLAAAETKYGYSDGWLSPDWMDECRAKLMDHIAKGDPRDVAAYCAFLWHHGASTVTSQPSQAPVVQASPEPFEVKRGMKVLTPDGRTVEVWSISDDSGVRCSDYQWHCASELRPASNADRASSGATPADVRMLTRDELNDVALSEQVGWGPGEYVEAIQRKFCEVNKLRIPADGVIGGV